MEGGKREVEQKGGKGNKKEEEKRRREGGRKEGRQKLCKVKLQRF